MQVVFMAKIVLDAGHGGQDPGAVQGERKEKDDTLALTLAVGKLLEKQGVDVVYTRADDVYQTPYEKAQISNGENPDFLVSIHRNSSPKENQYEGVETLVYDQSGDKLKMAEAINRHLERVGYQNLGTEERPGLVILRRTKDPALLVEAGFINSKKDNELFDEKFDETAQAIADGILEILNEEAQEEEKYYRVQTGAFRNQEYALDMERQLKEEGFPAFIVKSGDLYRVQVGAFKEMDNAIKMEAALRRRGYSTWIAYEPEQ